MSGIFKEALFVLAIVELFFAYTEYRYKPDVFYIVGRLLGNPKYIFPALILPLVYIVLRLLINVLFVS